MKKTLFALLLSSLSFIAMGSSEAQDCGIGNFMIDENGNCVDLNNFGRSSGSNSSPSSIGRNNNLSLLAQEYGIPKKYPAKGRDIPSNLLFFGSTQITTLEGVGTSKYYIDLQSITRSNSMVQWTSYSDVIGRGRFISSYNMSKNMADCESFEGTKLIVALYHNGIEKSGRYAPEKILQLESIEVIEISERRTIDYRNNRTPMGEKIEAVCMFSGYIY